MPEFARTRLVRILRWSEQYTATDMQYLVSGGFWLALDQVVGAIIALVLSIAFAHFLPKEEYGMYRYLLSVFWTLAAFTLTGLSAAISQSVARGFEGVYRRSFLTSLIWSAPMALIAIAMALYYGMHGNSVLMWGSFAIAILGPFMQPAYLFGSLLTGKKDFKRNAIYGIYLNLFPAVVLVGLMFISTDPLVFLVGYLGGNVAAGMALSIRSYRLHRPNDLVNPEFDSLSKHFSAMNILATIAQQMDKLAIFHVLGATELAVYSFAISFPEQIKGVFNSISNLALPKFAQRPVAEIRVNFWWRLWGLTGALGLAAVVYIIIAPFVFRILFPAYMDAVSYSQLFALSLVFVSSTVPVTLLQAHAAKRELYFFNLLSPIIQIASLVVFTMLWGLIGAVVARIFARGFSLAYGSILARSYMRRTE